MPGSSSAAAQPSASVRSSAISKDDLWTVSGNTATRGTEVYTMELHLEDYHIADKPITFMMTVNEKKEQYAAYSVTVAFTYAGGKDNNSNDTIRAVPVSVTSTNPN